MIHISLKKEINNMSKYNNLDFILCDSKRALLNLQGKINLRNKLVKTSSPSILLDKNINSENIEKKWNYKKLSIFQDSIYDYKAECYDILKKETSISKQEKIFFITIFADFHKMIYKSSCLDDDFLKKNILLLQMTKKATYSYTINPPWEYLLKNKCDLNILNYDTSDFFYSASINKETEKANLIDRVYMAGIETIVYRLKNLIYNKRLFNKKKKKVFILSENELLIEQTYKLIMKNYDVLNLNNFQFSLNKSVGLNNKPILRLIDITHDLVCKRIKEYVNINFVENTHNYFKNEVKENFIKYYQTLNFCREFLKNFSNINKNTFFFTGSSSSLKSLACSQAFKELKVKTISFQHGVTAEISGTHLFNRVFHSSSNCDYFAAFNQASKEICNINYFSDAKPIVLGLPKRYFRQRLVSKFKKHKNSLLYLSNNLYKGNIGNLVSRCTDYDIAIREISLLKQVFYKTNKNIYFKSYPTINPRYEDVDPINEYLYHRKINIIKSKIDARYILKFYTLILCSSATSTLSWSIYSNNPIIFINYHDRAPLQSEAYNLFIKSFFLFDFNKSDFYKNLLNFINLPIEEIQNKWNKMEEYRNNFINFYISSNNKNKFDLRKFL